MSQCFNRDWLHTLRHKLDHSAGTQWGKFQKLSSILQLAWLRSLKVYQLFPHKRLQACLVKFSETPTQSKWRCTRKNSKILRRHNFSAPCYQLFLIIVNYAYNSPDKFSKLGIYMRNWKSEKKKLRAIWQSKCCFQNSNSCETTLGSELLFGFNMQVHNRN